jgi:DNA gyrase subunit B
VGEAINDFLESNISVGDAIIENAIQAFQAAEAAKRARDRHRKSLL